MTEDHQRHHPFRKALDRIRHHAVVLLPFLVLALVGVSYLVETRREELCVKCGMYRRVATCLGSFRKPVVLWTSAPQETPFSRYLALSDGHRHSWQTLPGHMAVGDCLRPSSVELLGAAPPSDAAREFLRQSVLEPRTYHQEGAARHVRCQFGAKAPLDWTTLLLLMEQAAKEEKAKAEQEGDK